MKFNKLAAFGLAGILAVGSTLPFFAESTTESVSEAVELETEVEMAKAEYTLYNTTGETVTELYLTEHVRPVAEEEATESAAEEVETEAVTEAEEVEAENLVAENGLAAGETFVITLEAPADTTESKEFTLTFVTESGYVGEFATLHFEVAPIQLLAEDAVSGATQIAFGAPVEEVATEGQTE